MAFKAVPCLPYIDSDYDPISKGDVIATVVTHEMKLMHEENKNILSEYLAQQPQWQEPFAQSPLLQAELERVRSRAADAVGINLDKYSIEAPAASSKEGVAAAINNASVFLEHLSNQELNLELLHSYGPNAWRSYLTFLEEQEQLLQTKIKEVKDDCERINKERQTLQQAAQDRIVRLEREYHQILKNNIVLETALLERNVDISPKIDGGGGVDDEDEEETKPKKRTKEAHDEDEDEDGDDDGKEGGKKKKAKK